MLSNEITKILDDLGRRIGVAIDWSGENVMPYLNELMDRFIQWEISTSIIWGLIGIVFFVLGIFIAKFAWKNRNDYFGDPDEWQSWLFIAGGIMTITGVAVFMTQCFDICEAVFLPEKVIYDYISGLIASK